MYSLVMMTALTAAPDGPQFNGYFRDLFHRDNGCNGCSGAMRYSCSGGCSGATAYTSSCGGCCGGTIFGLGVGDRVRSFFQRDPAGYGCCGGQSYSCSGASYSCSGSAYSCFGGPAVSYTPVFNGGLSCQGGLPYSAPPPVFDTMPPPNVPFAVPAPAPGNVGLRSAPGAALASAGPASRATVLVKLPADARLIADGRTLTLTGSERQFVSPDLPIGQEFVYRFTAEYERAGETVSVTKKVPVRAGATATVEFTDLTAAKPAAPAAGTATATGSDKGVAEPTAREPVKAAPPVKPAAADRATITVKLPPGATLYVDDRRSPSLEPVRSFATPPLPAGREFAYIIKAEVTRNGQPETLTQKVPFRAGERVVVDFTSLGR